MKPRISIIIPSYNSAAYLDATIASLAQQDFIGFEVIVVDDRSGDDSVAVAENALAAHHLQGRVMSKPDNLPKGVASNRNYGIANATADWVSFLDSDDLFFPGKISNVLRLIERFGNTCQAYHHAIRQFEDETGLTLPTAGREGDTEPMDIFGELIGRNFITTSSVTVRKSLITGLGGFDNTLHGVEDYLMWLRIAKKTKWYYSGEPGTHYRVRKTSLMGGREMVHYVTQNSNLLKSARALHEFSDSELQQLEHSLFDEGMKYYALVSLNSRGWGDFLTGLRSLAAKGRGSLALQLFKLHFKNLVLKKIAGLLHKSVGGNK